MNDSAASSQLSPSDPIDRLTVSGDELARLAQSLLQDGQVDEAISLMKQSLAKAPGDSELRWFMAHVVCEQRGIDRGACEYDEVVAWSGTDLVADRRFLVYLLARSRVDIARRFARRLYGKVIDLAIDDTLMLSPGQVEIRLADGQLVVVFHPLFSFRALLIERLLTMLDYFVRAAGEQGTQGRYVLSLDDSPEGSGVQLCFSGNLPNHILIPDPHFMESGGYARFKQDVATTAEPWRERLDALYWRGSLTGVASSIGQILRLPRIQLCLARDIGHGFNCKVIRSGLSQYGNHQPVLGDVLENLDVLAEQDDALENRRYRYLLDIDGNTNSWSGMMTKLASGGVVFKLRSSFRQWYYDRLVDGDNVILVDDVRSGLDGALDRARADLPRCEAIARAGRTLADTITIESEYAAFLHGLAEFRAS